MKKIFLLLSAAFLAMGMSAQAATLGDDDEKNLDENIRKPGLSVRKHYYSPEELMFASNDKKKKNVITREEAERIAAEQQAAREAEEAKRRAELEELLNTDYSLVQYVQPDPEPYKWEDEDELLATVDKDSLAAQFKTAAITQNGDTQYLHKEVNSSFKENDFYFYFNTTNGVPGPLHFVGHYYADDPVEFVRLRFHIDIFKYQFTPTDIKRSRDGKFFAENFDDEFTAETRDLAAALAHCTYANMVLVSETGVSHRIFFTPEQLRHFRDTYLLYRLMGGK